MCVTSVPDKCNTIVAIQKNLDRNNKFENQKVI